MDYRKIKRADLPYWAKDAPSGTDFLLMDRQVSHDFIHGKITAIEYKKILDQSEIFEIE